MRKIVLASHSYLASGMLDAVELISGNQENIYPICAYVDDIQQVSKEIKKYLETLKSDDEVVIISDLFGGSVNNEILVTLSEYLNPNIHLISGMNLGLVLSLVTLLKSNQPLDQIIQQAIEQSNALICDNTSLIFSEKKEREEEDDIGLDE